MQKLFFFVFLFLSISSFAQAQETPPNYDDALADSLGADDYGMKAYTLVILKTGETTPKDEAEQQKLMRGHMENIGRLAEEGKLVVAGPMLAKNDRNYRGIFILDAKTVEEAKVLLATDPAIAANVFAVEIYPWYGSAALPMYLPMHEKVSKKSP